MAGSDDDGRTALNFRTFMKKAGIERSKHVPSAVVAVDPDVIEADGDVDVEEDLRADHNRLDEGTSLG